MALILYLLLLGVFSVPNGAARIARASLSTMELEVAETGPGNLIPTFLWQAGDAEGSTAVSPQATQPRPAEPTVDDSCGEAIFEGLMPDMRDPALPHLIQDGYTLNRTKKAVDVYTLENDLAIVTITPQWGGKIWDFAIKSPNMSKNEKSEYKSLLFRNPLHQPVNSGVLKAYTAGGIEFNWSPGIVGHTVFTDSQVHLGKLSTEKGDVIRVWEFDRFNSTVWQVDIFLEDTVLWIHPSITNPNTHSVPGYWWTNAGISTTTQYGVCKPKEGMFFGTMGSRAITPAYAVVNNAAGKLINASWPRFEQSCCSGDQRPIPDVPYPDLSYPGNHATDMDAFFRIWKDEGTHPYPYIAMVDRTIYGDEINGILHGHTLNGTKMWTWGQNKVTDWSQTLRKDGTGSGWGGCFTEQQTGVMPTQSQHFLLEANETKQWTEYFTPLLNIKSAHNLYSPNYDDAVEEVNAWINDNNKTNLKNFDEMNEFLERVSQMDITAKDVLVAGQPWGALEEKLQKRKLSNTVVFVSNSENEEVKQWYELIENGNFSKDTLSSFGPLSYGVSTRWQDLLEHTAENGGSWLHNLHLGIIQAEQGNIERAQDLTRKSLDMQPSSLAYRNLAVFEQNNVTKRHLLYNKSLFIAIDELKKQTVTIKSPISIYTANLVSEITQSFLADGDTSSTSTVLNIVTENIDNKKVVELIMERDLVVQARITVFLSRNMPDEAIGLLSNHSFPTMSLYRDDILDLWDNAWATKAMHDRGRILTPWERHEQRRAHPAPGSLGARAEWPNAGARAN
eukprot:m.17268 g.17268  ORF g.17268 m.17268 type:complete len:788 (-) comp5965_c0_seq1:284-2647(-)